VNPDLIDLAVRVVPFLLLLAVGLTAGAATERRHFSSIRLREERFRSLPAVTFSKPPADWVPERAGLVTGSVVVSLDYFKRFAASIRILFGGRVRSFEPLLDRGRREALVRMKEDALAAGYDAIINVRLESSRIANADGATTAGIEMLAYGTGLRLRNSPLNGADALSSQDT
jgi:uncharacterized protein YbjQ (UPF0145 family)